MKLTDVNRTVIQSDHRMRTKAFGIRAEDSPIIMEMMRSKIYSNKPAAVVREYATNALDEHKLHNIERPVDITLPSISNPELKVRDYGKGLNYDEITEIYVNYGCSTKRNTNDLTGGLGIGCKAGFAYGSQFTITSISVDADGKTMKRVYIANIDEDNVGTLNMADEVESDEPTGIEIGVGVNVEDVEKFRQEAWNLYLTCTVKPNLIGMDEEDLDITTSLEDTEEGYRRYESNYNFRQHCKYSTAVAVMGNIGYPIQAYHIGSMTSEHREFLKDNTLFIDFDIGELSIASNREELEYNSQTVNALKERTKKILESCVKEVTDQILVSKCLFDRQAAYSKLAGDMPYAVKQIVNERLDSSIVGITLNIPDGKSVHYQWKSHGHRTKLFADSDVRYVRWGPGHWNNGELFVILANKGLAQGNITRRVKSFMQSCKNAERTEVLILYKAESTSNADAISDAGLPYIDPDKLLNIEDYEPLKPQKSAVKGDKSTSHVSLFKRNDNERGFYQMESNMWIDAGTVSLSSTDKILYMHLSGVSAIRPESKDTSASDREPRMKLGKDDYGYLENIAYGLSEYLTDDEKKELASFYKDGKFGLPNGTVYGVRKAHYDIIEELPNAVNVFELVQDLAKRKLKAETESSTLLQDALTVSKEISTNFSEVESSYSQLRWDGQSNYRNRYHYGSERNDQFKFMEQLSHKVRRISSEDEGRDHTMYSLSFGWLKKARDKTLANKVYQIHRALEDKNAHSLIKAIKWLGLEEELKKIKSKGALKEGEMFKILKKVHERWPLFNAISIEMREMLSEAPNDRDCILFDYPQKEGESEEDYERRKQVLKAELTDMAIDDMHKYLNS